MYDAAAKLPTGLLAGNINQLGNYDQCLRVHSGSAADEGDANDADPVRGKYCLAYMQPIVPPGDQPRLRRLHELIQSHSAFSSDFDDVR